MKSSVGCFKNLAACLRHKTVYAVPISLGKFNLINAHRKHLLYKQFVAFHCRGCSVAPLIEYAQDPIFPELQNERGMAVTLDSTSFLKDAAAKKNQQQQQKKNPAKLRVFGHLMEEYIYMLRDQGPTLKHKICSIGNKNDLGN